MKAGFLDKLIERIDKLDQQNLQSQFLQLVREKGLLETVFNALHEGILVLDGRGYIIYANSAAAGLLGFSLENALRQPIRRFLKDIEWDAFLNWKEQSGSTLLSRDLEISYPQHKYLSFYVMPLALKEPGDHGAVVIFRDITREREKELVTLKSDQINTLTLLAAGVAHEIGNPLNSLHIHLQLLDREIQRLNKADRDPLQELVTVSRHEVERLNLTITQFLRAIRPTAPRREVCALAEVLQETLAFMKHEIENRDILVEVQTPDAVPKISVDRNQIKQAFFNIIKNALQAMSKGSLLTIRLFSTDRYAGISFRDTGRGISAQDLSRLFEPYRTTKPHGTGLGLMIVQRIARDHGGEIELHSQPGVGTTFTLLLPLDERRIRLLKAPRQSQASRRKSSTAPAPDQPRGKTS